MNILGTLNQINGRDKTARCLQYLCRFLDYININNPYKYQFLEYQLSTFRKLMRFGRSLESFYLASQSIRNEDILKRLSGLAKVAHGCFLFCDHFLLMKKLQLLQINTNVWTTSANKYWLLSIVINLIHNYYEIKKTVQIHKKNCNKSVSTHFKLNFHLYIDIIKNVCDIFIPLSALNYAKVNPGIIGLLGMLSSIAGILSLILVPTKKT